MNISIAMMTQLINAQQIGRVTVVSYIPSTNGYTYVTSAFSDSFQKVVQSDNINIIPFGTEIYQRVVTSTPILTKEQYINTLTQFRNSVMSVRGDISFRTDDDLYEDYRTQMEISPAAGVISFIDSTFERMVINSNVVPILPGTHGIRLTLPAFSKMVYQLYPKLELNIVNIKLMYENYTKNKGYTNEEFGVNPIFANSNSVDDVYNFIDNVVLNTVGRDLSYNDIQEILSRSQSDRILDTYFRYMVSIGLRENQALEMLVLTKNFRNEHHQIREVKLGIDKITRKVLYDMPRGHLVANPDINAILSI